MEQHKKRLACRVVTLLAVLLFACRFAVWTSSGCASGAVHGFCYSSCPSCKPHEFRGYLSQCSRRNCQRAARQVFDKSVNANVDRFSVPICTGEWGPRAIEGLMAQCRVVEDILDVGRWAEKHAAGAGATALWPRLADKLWCQRPSRILGKRPTWLPDASESSMWAYSNLVSLVDQMGSSRVKLALGQRSLFHGDAVLSGNMWAITACENALSVLNSADGLVAHLSAAQLRAHKDGSGTGADRCQYVVPKLCTAVIDSLKPWRAIARRKDLFALRDTCDELQAWRRHSIVGKKFDVDEAFSEYAAMVPQASLPLPQDLCAMGYQQECMRKIGDVDLEIGDRLRDVLKHPDSLLCRYVVRWFDNWRNNCHGSRLAEIAAYFESVGREKEDTMLNTLPGALLKQLDQIKLFNGVEFETFDWLLDAGKLLPENSAFRHLDWSVQGGLSAQVSPFTVRILTDSHQVVSAAKSMKNCATSIITSLRAQRCILITLNLGNSCVAMGQWAKRPSSHQKEDEGPSWTQLFGPCNKQLKREQLEAFTAVEEAVSFLFSCSEAMVVPTAS